MCGFFPRKPRRGSLEDRHFLQPAETCCFFNTKDKGKPPFTSCNVQVYNLRIPAQRRRMWFVKFDPRVVSQKRGFWNMVVSQIGIRNLFWLIRERPSGLSKNTVSGTTILKSDNTWIGVWHDDFPLISQHVADGMRLCWGFGTKTHGSYARIRLRLVKGGCDNFQPDVCVCVSVKLRDNEFPFRVPLNPPKKGSNFN